MSLDCTGLCKDKSNKKKDKTPSTKAETSTKPLKPQKPPKPPKPPKQTKPIQPPQPIQPKQPEPAVPPKETIIEDPDDICPPPTAHSTENIHKKKERSAFRSLAISLKKKSGPPWYQELSPGQMASADGLQNSLRDDLEQYSTSKTRALVSNIGLSPIPNNKNLAMSINMSRGNDLAFLWFLNEIFYNTKSLHDERTDYSVNEKLILSSIAHLDMITTLRELDRILPKPQATQLPRKPITHHMKKIKYASPYLEPLTRPKMPVSRIFLPPKKHSVPVNPYEVYKDRTFTPPNEQNRWYAVKQRKQSDIDREKLLKTVCSGSATNFEQRKDQIFDQFLELTKCQRSKRTHVVYQVDLDNANTSDEFEVLAKQYQDQMIVRTIVRDLLENALTVQKLRACCKTIECMMDYEKYLCVLERNMDQQKHSREEPKYFDISECKFDYDKIFNDETFEQKQSQSGYLSSEIDKRMGGKCTEVCMRNLFCLEIPLWTEPSCDDDKDKDMDENECEDEGGSSIQSEGKESNPPLDPNDPEEIHTELEDALKKMKKNPKFVLASIPLAADIPILVEFTFQRYGRTFTDKERLKFFKKRDKQYDKLKKAKLDVKPPKADAISTTITSVTWDQRGWLIRRTNEVLDDYYHRVKQHFLEQTRLFWPILGPYLCTDGIPREVFYAYMPSSEKEIFAFRPWRVGDGKGGT